MSDEKPKSENPNQIGGEVIEQDIDPQISRAGLSSQAPKKPTTLSCPACETEVTFDLAAIPKEFPFCSMRCKALDLGAWLEPDPEDEEADAEAELD